MVGREEGEGSGWWARGLCNILVAVIYLSLYVSDACF